eukprot:CAMPEP_0171464012 /NCGR_PEP_ID=MMETSP0945-20130129/7467_1 /TAXON_ID=109269 /ORGANISM="Vaucheria litorea, Strain CCMP2940" /LENGTH=478 /DNA_ID=CAMNT_0011990947 /DNA_START=96 /DNA_END=1529 /DNA_ORIENTATION=-
MEIGPKNPNFLMEEIWIEPSQGQMLAAQKNLSDYVVLLLNIEKMEILGFFEILKLDHEVSEYFVSLATIVYLLPCQVKISEIDKLEKEIFSEVEIVNIARKMVKNTLKQTMAASVVLMQKWFPSIKFQEPIEYPSNEVQMFKDNFYENSDPFKAKRTEILSKEVARLRKCYQGKRALFIGKEFVFQLVSGLMDCLRKDNDELRGMLKCVQWSGNLGTDLFFIEMNILNNYEIDMINQLKNILPKIDVIVLGLDPNDLLTFQDKNKIDKISQLKNALEKVFDFIDHLKKSTNFVGNLNWIGSLPIFYEQTSKGLGLKEKNLAECLVEKHQHIFDAALEIFFRNNHHNFRVVNFYEDLIINSHLKVKNCTWSKEMIQYVNMQISSNMEQENKIDLIASDIPDILTQWGPVFESWPKEKFESENEKFNMQIIIDEKYEEQKNAHDIDDYVMAHAEKINKRIGPVSYERDGKEKRGRPKGSK